MTRPSHNTTLLPRQLREELGLKDTSQTGARHSGARNELSRKERRKAERSRKGTGPQQGRSHNQKRKQRDEAFDDGHGGKRAKARQPDKPQKLKSILKRTNPVEPESEESDLDNLDIDLDEGEDEYEDSEVDPEPNHRKIPQAVQDKLTEDDAEIAALEKKLGLKNKKKLPKVFAEDGLGDLLGDLESGSDAEEKKRKREGEEWLQRKRQKAQMYTERAGEHATDSEEMDDEDEEDEGEDFSQSEDDEFEGFDDDNDELAAQKPKQRENPYRPPGAASDVAATKYVPPSKRIPSSESESSSRLRRQIQGHLNKLSEANMISILGDIESLYREHPRQTMTSMLIELLFGLVCSGGTLNDTFIILHAGFIAALYKVVGMEFGAEFIQNIVERFDYLYEMEEKEEPNKKSMTNMLSLLSHLYNFHVIGCGLMFDYIRLFLKTINELNTELLLKVVRNSGPQLRQDDPSALKDIVLLIQPAVARVEEATLSVRTKFMIEMITDLKNNKLKNAPGASISSEHITKMRKILGSLNTRATRATEPLRIGRADIHNSDKRGKWWLVGASWKAGSTSNADTDMANVNPHAVLPDTLDDDLGDGRAVDLAQLARTHRMNTQVRRSIFVAILSASDCQDAHVRLTKLRLKRNQETEIPQVLIHCASEEAIEE
ncbi:predicted protein [Uncinocarpus reesii 1704]|uniref:MI domain-containing protein n=1 Tax=Uncinocarpus reesii (strain UAMH 1704) TaxID=336963 RepID=C4JWX6_UNCRE|nr:uncharacterized protein UREG_06149 [Uncinocarpus reesii 1704]EEP81284.1 predicted protein [Uncinocarpus reesii 1704]